MKINRISRKSEILAFFKEYELAVSDDLDEVEVLAAKMTISREGKYVYEVLTDVLKEIKIMRGERFVVKLYHDCGGCCIEKCEKILVFEASRS